MPSSLNTAQAKIAVTGTWQACPSLPALSHHFPNVVIKAKATNAAALVFASTSSGSVAADGTGVGFILDPGAQVAVNIANFNSLFVAGTANDVLSGIGN